MYNVFEPIAGIVIALRLKLQELQGVIGNIPLLSDMFSGIIKSLIDFLWDLRTLLYTAGTWQDWIELQLSPSAIWDAISWRIPAVSKAVADVVAWFESWVNNVLEIIESWWIDKANWVQVQVSNGAVAISAAIKQLTTAYVALQNAWTDFTTLTLPKLLTIDWIEAFFGAGVTGIGDFLGLVRIEIDERIQAKTGILSVIIAGMQSIITDPEEWLLEKVENMLARYW